MEDTVVMTVLYGAGGYAEKKGKACRRGSERRLVAAVTATASVNGG